MTVYNAGPWSRYRVESTGDMHRRCLRAFDAWKNNDGMSVLYRNMPYSDLALSLLCTEDVPFRNENAADTFENRARILAQLDFLKDPDTYLRKLAEVINEIVEALDSNAPPQGDSPFVTTRAEVYSVELLDELVSYLCQLDTVLVQLRRQIIQNVLSASGIECSAEQAIANNRKRIFPLESGLSSRQIVQTYYRYTPFEEYFEQPVTLDVPLETHFSHAHIIGGSGAGKTQWLSQLILYYVESGASLVVVDSQGDLIDKLSHLRAIEDRCILIDPKDVEHPPQINIFDINRRFGQYDAVAREQVEAGAIQTLDFLFTGILGADLTAKQGVFFRLVSRLMLALPKTMGRNATILDMLALMEDDGPYQAAIASLPRIQRGFFEQDFRSKTFAQTKEQIRYRLHAILENPTLERLFTAEETKLDIFAELNRGSVILVDTAKDFLKGTSAHFGQIFITLVLQAILERAALPERERHPASLVIDEAAEYFSQNIDDILTQCRKYRCGAVFAHQYLDQAASSLRASLAANTAIKMASAVSAIDARYLAPNLNTTADFILKQPRLHFATFIRNITPQALSIPVRVGLLDEQEQVGDFDAFIARNRTRVAAEPQAATEPVARPMPATEPVRASATPPRAEEKRESLDTPSTAATEGW